MGMLWKQPRTRNAERAAAEDETSVRGNALKTTANRERRMSRAEDEASVHGNALKTVANSERGMSRSPQVNSASQLGSRRTFASPAPRRLEPGGTSCVHSVARSQSLLAVASGVAA